MNVRAEILAGRNVTVRPLAREAGISASGLYGLIAKGEVAAIRIGRRVLVPAAIAARLLDLPERPIA